MDKRYLDLLKKGAGIWNKLREENPEQKVNLSGSQLSRRDLSEFDLSNINLSGADLTKTDLTNAKLENSSLARAILSEAKLPKRHLFGTDLSETDLSFSDLTGAILTNSNLNQANLKGASFQYADLTNANLVETLAIATNFAGANFTGACIENWRISSETHLEEVTCDYIYLKVTEKNGKIDFQERRPRNINEIFSPDEFAILVRQTLKTIDLIFIDGIDWQVFFSSFQELSKYYKNSALNIQAIERKKESFVVRLEVSVTSNEAEIESSFKELYEQNIKQLERQVANYAKLIEAEKVEKSTLMGIVKTMAESQGSKYDLRGSKFGGGFAAEGGYQSGGQFNDYSIQIDANIDEITRLIQSLKAATKTFPEVQQADIEVEIEELQADLADKRKRDPKRLGKRVRSLWLAACAIAVGVAGVADFSNNLLELSEKLDIPIAEELIQQNPHILPNG